MIEPRFKKGAFNCPHCTAHAQMGWVNLGYQIKGLIQEQTEFHMARCLSCRKASIWLKAAETGDSGLPLPPAMIWPTTLTAPPPHPDLPAAAVADYNEARQVANASPRAAAALLRLCVQKICIALKLPGNNINNDIGELVKRGLPFAIQQAFDVVRVIGNNAVHPGEMSQDDHTERVSALFGLVNLVVQQMITQPKEIEAMYASLPKGALEAIEKRDAPKQT